MKYLILNYKTYPESTGEGALRLTKIVSEIEVPNGLKMIVAPNTAQLATLKEEYPELTFWTQHIDAYEPGKTTGRVTIPIAKYCGSTGTLLNHSERPLSDESLVTVSSLTKKYDYISCVCVPSIDKAEKIFVLQPDIVSFEPPELISTPTSLVDTDISLAIDFVDRYQDKRLPLILGAGVRDAGDISRALEIGYSGVLLSSGFVLSNDPKAFLQNMVLAFARAL